MSDIIEATDIPFAIRVIDCEQGSEEWLQARVGKVTGSRMADVMATIKSGEAAARRDYKAEIVCETINNLPTEDGFVSKEMQRGRELEMFARAAYEVKTGMMVDQVGLVLHPSNDRWAASPDGVIFQNGEPVGCLEIKCPKMATHMKYLLEGSVPSEYVYQVQWEMACIGVKWCDFVSYDYRWPEEQQILIVRVNRDDALIAKMEAEATKFLFEVDSIVRKLAKVGNASLNNNQIHNPKDEELFND